MREYHSELFPHTPVIFCGVNNFNQSMLKGHKLFTGVVEEIDIKSSLTLVLTLHPDIRTVVFVNDKTTTGLAVKSGVLAIAPLFADRVAFEFIEDFDFHRDEWEASIETEDYLNILEEERDIKNLKSIIKSKS